MDRFEKSKFRVESSSDFDHSVAEFTLSLYSKFLRIICGQIFFNTFTPSAVLAYLQFCSSSYSRPLLDRFAMTDRKSD